MSRHSREPEFILETQLEKTNRSLALSRDMALKSMDLVQAKLKRLSLQLAMVTVTLRETRDLLPDSELLELEQE